MWWIILVARFLGEFLLHLYISFYKYYLITKYNSLQIIIKIFSLPFQLYHLFSWLNNPYKPKWTFKNAYPTNWMLLSFVMLHSHFVSCVAGAYWNNIITIDIERHTLTTIE